MHYYDQKSRVAETNYSVERDYTEEDQVMDVLGILNLIYHISMVVVLTSPTEYFNGSLIVVVKSMKIWYLYLGSKDLQRTV